MTLPPLHLSHLISFIISLLLCASLSSWAEAPALELAEEKAKAVLLYNFIKQTEWQGKENKKTIDVVFLNGDMPFYKAFENIAAATTVKNKTIRLKRLNNYKNAASADVLVIPPQYNNKLNELAAYLSHTQTLLITDNSKDRSAVMINFVYPSVEQISFEVNRSNLVFENINISKDILLYGGNEVEIATLYKDMEKNLIYSKEKLSIQEKKLSSQANKLNQQASILESQVLEIEQKNNYIAQQQQDIDALNEERSSITQLLDDSVEQLSMSRERLNAAEKRLQESRVFSQQLTDKISINAAILAKQTQQISSQDKRINAQLQKLGKQEDTISSQRGIIVAILSALLFVTLYIILKQKLALGKERAISNKKTEIVKSQEASIETYKSSLQVKNDFLTAINHELRTPLHLIMGALQGISSDDKNSLQHSLGIVEDGAEQMMLLISDILFYSELQSEQLEINTNSVDIKYQLFEACEMYRSEAEDKGLGFFVHFSRAVPQYLKIDVERLCIIIDKLVDNAIKYTQEGEVVINVDWKVSQGPQLHIDINDTGVGFSESELARAFQPFDQSDNGLTRQNQGLGIGLSISEKLIKAMKGDITIDSNQHQGSRVHLQLPAAKALHDKFSQDKGMAEIKPFPSDKNDKQFKSAKLQAVSPMRLAVDNTKAELFILVVEDNPVSQVVVEKIIKNLGYQCLLASNGEQALRLIADKKPDLVLMDIQMPNMSGIECTQQYRQSKHCHQPPIVALTANPVESIRKQCFEVGMAAVLSKPIDIQLLEGEIKRLIADRKIESMEV